MTRAVMRTSHRPAARGRLTWLCLALAAVGCGPTPPTGPPRLHWYVFNEPSGAFAEAARRCSTAAGGAYTITLVPLPADADQQREQLVRRLAARDDDIDLIGMDVIWTAEFAEAGWILPWPAPLAREVRDGRIAGPVASGTYHERLWAAPFTTNAQLLWYRADRVPVPPATWDEMIDVAEALGAGGHIQVQGERYEGLTVFFVSLLASAGGAVLDADGRQVALEDAPTRATLTLLRRLADSPAADPALASSREDHARLAFESGRSAFMVNYTYVWPSAQANAPTIAEHLRWARWPAVVPGQPSRVTIGGINLAVAAHSRWPEQAFAAAACLVSTENQRIAAEHGGLPPTTDALYDDPAVRRTFPFADVLRATLEDAVQRPQSPLYSDISLAITRTLHPLDRVEPDRDTARLREAVRRALRSEGLL